MAGNECSGRKGKAKERNAKKYTRSFKYNVPGWFSKLAKEYWKRNLNFLTTNNAISDKDYDAFCRLCDLYAKWRECQETLNKDGTTYETFTDRGALRIIKHPKAELELQYHKEMLNLERRFGLTPIDGKAAGIKQEKPGKKKARGNYAI